MNWEMVRRLKCLLVCVECSSVHLILLWRNSHLILIKHWRSNWVTPGPSRPHSPLIQIRCRVQDYPKHNQTKSPVCRSFHVFWLITFVYFHNTPSRPYLVVKLVLLLYGAAPSGDVSNFLVRHFWFCSIGWAVNRPFRSIIASSATRSCIGSWSG